ncbi:phage tail protein [Brevundimonas naejangsanensis]|uniref:phage tail protein n=1 Tax=Brevundimonas TaxID=41275 RepID=UPI0026F079BA|nr:phage tail protein [Brevundimonas naejangsanensis]
MAMMALGLFVFDLPTLTYDQLQRRTSWRHAFGERVGARPAGQFLGEGDDDITLTGRLAPIAFGDAGSLDDLRTMGKSGEAWPLVDGAGRVYGAFVITGLDETQRAIMDNGVARISDFTLSLKRVDDDLDDEGVAP